MPCAGLWHGKTAGNIYQNSFVLKSSFFKTYPYRHRLAEHRLSGDTETIMQLLRSSE